MSDYDYDLLCIGSGPAGQRAAVQASKLGKRVAVIEREQTIGGVCLHTGTIPSKTFREAVLSFANGSRPFGAGNAPKSKRPTAGELFARVGDIVAREEQVQESQLWRNDIEVLVGTASFADPHTVSVVNHDHTQRVKARNIMVAVGTCPVPVQIGNFQGEGIVSSDEIFSLETMPHSMAVIGCGVIGVEYAAMFAMLGVNVTVVDGRERPLEFLDREIIDELVHQMRHRNVLFRLGETVERLETRQNGRGKVVIHLESGKRLVTDLALVCAGRAGATKELNLAAAGLEADSRGRLVVDENFRTAVPHIYAAGDVIGFPSLAATSSEQGRLAACHAFGVPAGPMPTNFPVGIYSIPEISMVGPAEHELTLQKVPYEIGIARFREIARGQILGDDTGFLKLIFHREDRRLLSVHAVGTGATELIHIGQCVMGLGGGLDYFLQTVFNYPTLAECYKVAALDAHNKLSL